uniref:Uncharacterized protein n=1 Tax=Strongyloides stercoralis TaxID=6248 RepID=A0AAF5CSJ2_STRER
MYFRCLFSKNIISTRSNFFTSQTPDKTINNFLSSNLQNTSNKKLLDFSKYTATEDFGSLLDEADVCEKTNNFLDIPTKPRTLDFYSSLNFYTEAEKQHIDLSSFLDDVVHIEDSENIENEVKITLDGNRIETFNIKKMKKFVKGNDYENIVNELNNKKWPNFRNNHTLFNQILKIVIENSNYHEAKDVLNDFANSDYTTYLENSLALYYFKRILEQSNLETVINEMDRLHDLFLLNELSMICNKAKIKKIESKSNEQALEIFDLAYQMKYTLPEIEKLWKALLSKGYITSKAIYFEFAVSKLLDMEDIDLAMSYWDRQRLEFLESTCFPYFYKFLNTNNISPNQKLYRDIIEIESKMNRSTAVFANILVCLIEMNKISEAKTFVKNISLTPLEYKRLLKKVDNKNACDVLAGIIKETIKK